jgi:hypothetical protein
VLRRLLVCLAFATCCFLNAWVAFAEGQSAYFARHDPFHAIAVPVLCWEIVLTSGIFAVWEFCRWRGLNRALLLHALFLASCSVPLGIVAVAALRLSPFDLVPIIRKPLFWPVALIIAIAPLIFAVLRPYTASHFMQATFLYSWPVLGLVLVQAARGPLLRYPQAAYADGPLAPALNSPPPPVRVVWVIFDELSQTIGFGNRPPDLHLPNFDRLRSESFYATSAKAPGRSTQISMTALILGEQVVEAVPQGPDNLEVRIRSRPEPFAWGSTPNVFDTARALGFNTALVGWYQPYGRLLNRSLTKCYWTAGWLVPGIEEPFQCQLLPSAMRDRAKQQFVSLPLVGHMPGVFPETYQLEEKRRRFSYLLDRAREIVADPTIGLVLLHLPIPHPPAIYSRSKGMMTVKGGVGYLDSVALADQTLGDLRRTMEQVGLWDRTALLVSADHGWRTNIWRGAPDWTGEEEAASRDDTSGIPFLLKLPGWTSGVTYIKPFDTVVTRQIITSILSWRLTDPAEVPDAITGLGAAAH